MSPAALRISLLSPPCVDARQTPTRRACEAAKYFGLDLESRSLGAIAPTAPTGRKPLLLAPGRIALLTGPSGGGKSTLLRQMTRAARQSLYPSWRIVDPSAVSFRAGAVVDQVGRDAREAVHLLAFAGLAEARKLVARPAALSDGERWRLALARAFDQSATTARKDKLTLLVIDEFAATLDRPTARSVAALVRRFIAQSDRIAAVVATSHDDLERALAPDVVVRTSLFAPPRIEERVLADCKQQFLRLRIDQGSIADYDALAPMHYLGGRPATWPKVLRALAPTGARGEQTLAGALVVSMPTLHGRWRALAWPGRYSLSDVQDKRAAAYRLNNELRCLSRVVVDPRFRGQGVATRLVRAYLRNPESLHTEAIAAMGRFASFFVRAGMTAYPLIASRRDLRLLDALNCTGVAPWRLAQPGSAWRRAIDGAGEAFMIRETRIWARAAGASASLVDAPAADVFRIAARRIAFAPIAYAHAAQPAV